MAFSKSTVIVLKHFTAHPPATADRWHMLPPCPHFCLMLFILKALFPEDADFIVTPQQRIPDDSESHIPDLVIEVVKLTQAADVTFRTVLIVKIKNSQHWPRGIPALDRQVSRHTDAAFAGTAHSKVYWIGALGPHWRYGINEDGGQPPVPLIPWHDVTHDDASYADFQKLVSLVSAL
ncbi:hypothetical protein B0H10DRAFT_1961061 [Mycena sp. CBHHK59/15]|nr:hypothetical protein B0H10DRAFT_1961061 [Mycena sp. CBHHK59/15]